MEIEGLRAGHEARLHGRMASLVKEPSILTSAVSARPGGLGTSIGRRERSTTSRAHMRCRADGIGRKPGVRRYAEGLRNRLFKATLRTIDAKLSMVAVNSRWRFQRMPGVRIGVGLSSGMTCKPARS